MTTLQRAIEMVRNYGNEHLAVELESLRDQEPVGWRTEYNHDDFDVRCPAEQSCEQR